MQNFAECDVFQDYVHFILVSIWYSEYILNNFFMDQIRLFSVTTSDDVNTTHYILCCSEHGMQMLVEADSP